MSKFFDKMIGAVRSLTVWVNAAFLVLLPFSEQIISALPQLQAFLPDNVYKAVGAGVIIANLLLRFRTKTALELK